MMLSEHLAVRGLLPMGTAAASAFSAIRAFLFGEEYTVELLLDGKVSSYRFDTLSDALDVFRSEFSRDDHFIPEIQIVAYSATRDPKFGAISEPVGNERTGFTPAEMQRDRKAHIQAAFAQASANQIPTFGAAPDRVLAVTRAERNMMFPAPPVEHYAEEIEKAVTLYSLSGTWDQMNGRSNL